MFILDFFAVQYSRIPQPLGRLNSATIGHIAIILLHFTLNIVNVKTIRNTYDIRTLSWPNIVKSTKQMKILDILSKMCYIEKNIGSIENLNDDFLIAILPNIYQTSCKKKKWNRINRLRVENRNVKKEHFTSKWNNNGKTMKSYFKWS